MLFFKVQISHKILKNQKFPKPFAASSTYKVKKIVCLIWAESNNNFVIKMDFFKNSGENSKSKKVTERDRIWKKNIYGIT